MRCCYFLIFVLLFFACQKSEDVSPANSENENTVQKNDEGQQANNANSQKLSEPVEVTYVLKSKGSSIADAKYKVGEETYSACGNKEFKFTFEASKTLNLELTGTIKNQPGHQIEARISVDGNVVAQEILEADGENGVHTQVKVNHQIQERNYSNLK